MMVVMLQAVVWRGVGLLVSFAIGVGGVKEMEQGLMIWCLRGRLDGECLMRHCDVVEILGWWEWKMNGLGWAEDVMRNLL